MEILKREIKNNKIQKKENKNIINIFLSNIKEPMVEIRQKRELPKIPVVPGLILKLPDAINNMIFHYVGYKHKVAAEIAFQYINHGPAFSCIRRKQIKIASHIANMHFQLEHIHSMEKRRTALISMPCWVQKYILGTHFKYLFPWDRKEYARENIKLQEDLERKYKIKKGSLTKDFNQYERDYTHSYRMLKDNYNNNEQCDFID